MQIQIFRVAAGDAVGVEELNRFLRGHRVLSVDRHFEEGAWHFCVCHQASGALVSGQAATVSPARASRAGLIDTPSTSTRPSLIAACANDRDRYNRMFRATDPTACPQHGPNRSPAPPLPHPRTTAGQHRSQSRRNGGSPRV